MRTIVISCWFFASLALTVTGQSTRSVLSAIFFTIYRATGWASSISGNRSEMCLIISDAVWTPLARYEWFAAYHDLLSPLTGPPIGIKISHRRNEAGTIASLRCSSTCLRYVFCVASVRISLLKRHSNKRVSICYMVRWRISRNSIFEYWERYYILVRVIPVSRDVKVTVFCIYNF